MTTNRRPYGELFLVSFLLLFFELACIRWFGSTVVFLTFFTNIVLLATFLGMSVGCLSSSGRKDWTGVVMPLFLLTAVLACGTLWSYNTFGRVMVDVGGQGSPQQVYFGTEYRARDVASLAVPIELLAGVFFVLIALVFVGVGQVMGRALNAANDRLLAYICNIAGSLAGIAAFGLASYLRTTPVLWFAVIGVLWMYALERRTTLQISSLVGMLIFMALVSYNATTWTPFQDSPTIDLIAWSPYYKIQYTPATQLITTNNIAHQQMSPLDEGGAAYLLPHWVNRDSGRQPFANVLIIGAGSGNDVAAALANGAKHVDAVEIDPVINEIGKAAHPRHPYQDPRVTIHIDDGRSFLRHSSQQYDLIVYALVDSLVLHSGYSSLRLESFLFTQEAFADIAGRLSPNGIFAVYNYFRQGWIIGRIQKMAENAFGAPPLVMSLPYIERINTEDPGAGITFVMAGREQGLENIRRAFETSQSYWFGSKPAMIGAMGGFSPQPPPVTEPGRPWNRLALSTVEAHGSVRVPTDDWPFLYLRERVLPALNVRMIALLGMLSMVILSIFSPVRATRPNWHMFFLGAGFMVIETKGVVHMALLFGSTWTVNSVVFFAVLTMVLASNVFVWAVESKRLWPYYALLVVSLVVDLLVPMQWFLSLPGSVRIVASCAVTFVPVLFAGIVFGASFRDSREPALDFASNIAGAILGGFAESLSLVVGFNDVIAIALGFYVLSAVLRRRSGHSFSPPPEQRQ